MSSTNHDPHRNGNPVDRSQLHKTDSNTPDSPDRELETGLDIELDIDHDSSDLETSHLEVNDLNQLHQLATQAIESGLILGHGYHQGQYEILRRNEVLLFSPDKAVDYLKTLLDSQTNIQQEGDS